MARNIKRRSSASELFPALTGFSGKNELVFEGPLLSESIQCELVITADLYNMILPAIRRLNETIPGDPSELYDIQWILRNLKDYLASDIGPIFFWSERTDRYVYVDEIIDIISGSDKEGDYYIQLIAEGIPTQVRIQNICPHMAELSEFGGVLKEGVWVKKLL